MAFGGVFLPRVKGLSKVCWKMIFSWTKSVILVIFDGFFTLGLF